MGLVADLARPRAAHVSAPAVETRSDSDVCEVAEAFLGAVYSDELALFPYSTALRDDTYVSTYSDCRAVRYTINSLLGLREAAASTGNVGDLAAVDERIHAFCVRHPSIPNPGDRGLMLVLLAHRGNEREISQGVSDVAAHVDSALNLQELAWMIWGASAAARAGIASAEPVASRLVEMLLTRYVDLRSGLARHVHSGYRRDVVSFGSTVYYLRALHEYGSTFDHRIALELFDRGVQSMIRIQGPLGEWPWLIDVGSSMPVDPYPIFAVHQDSMAMLFLHPALARGISNAQEAITSSVGWVVGANEIATPMIRCEPAFAYRSLERRDVAPRVRRYLRARRGAADEWSRATVRINRECRSYHLGWILFVWSSRRDRWSVDESARQAFAQLVP